VSFHVFLESGLGEALDDKTGPVYARAVAPGGAGLENQRVGEARDDVWAGVGGEVEVGLVFEEERVAGVVSCAGGMG